MTTWATWIPFGHSSPRKRLCQTADGELGAAERGRTPSASNRRRRAGEQHRPSASGEHVGQSLLAAQERPPRTNAPRLLKPFLGQAVEVSPRRVAGVIDQRVDRAEPFPHGGEPALHLSWIGDVRRHGKRRQIFPLQLPFQILNVLW